MSLDIQGLKLAIDTGNPEFYNGCLGDALSELVDELETVRLALGDTDCTSVVELVEEYDKLWRDDDRVVERVDGCSCVKEGEDGMYSIVSNDGTKLTIATSELKEGRDYEIVIKEL